MNYIKPCVSIALLQDGIALRLQIRVVTVKQRVGHSIAAYSAQKRPQLTALLDGIERSSPQILMIEPIDRPSRRNGRLELSSIG